MRLVRLDEVFDVTTGKDLVYRNLIAGEYNVVGQGKDNNGVVGTTEKLEDYTLYSANKGITLGHIGNFSASVQATPFYIGTRVKYLEPKETLTLPELLYYTKVINVNSYRFTYGRVGGARIDLLKIPHPDDIPEWVYTNTKMSEYDGEKIKRAMGKRPKEPDGYTHYKIGDLFEVARGKRHKISDHIEGEIPYIAATSLNNGVTKTIGNPIITFTDALVVTTFCDSFYAEGKFTASDEVSILQHNNMTKYSGLYIIPLIEKNKYKYSFGRKAYNKEVQEMQIQLPSKKVNGVWEPDWDYMEEYIKSLPYSASI